MKSFMILLENSRRIINDPAFMFINRVQNTYFTKSTSKMSFKEAIWFILKGVKKTLQIELDEWFESLGGENTMQNKDFRN